MSLIEAVWLAQPCIPSVSLVVDSRSSCSNELGSRQQTAGSRYQTVDSGHPTPIEDTRQQTADNLPPSTDTDDSRPGIVAATFAMKVNYWEMVAVGGRTGRCKVSVL
jgi:hypothetical protein